MKDGFFHPSPLPLFSLFLFLDFVNLDSSSSAQPLPSLWLPTPPCHSLSSLIFWLCWFLQGFLDRLFLKQIYVFATSPCPTCVITHSSPALTSLVDNKRFSSGRHTTVVVRTHRSMDHVNLKRFCVSLPLLFVIFRFCLFMLF
jgi:hypothetical protein